MTAAFEECKSILETFSFTTGVPAFHMDDQGVLLQKCEGFSPEELQYADLKSIQDCCTNREKNPPLQNDRYYTFFTENLFIYAFVSLEEEAGDRYMVAGPMRFRPIEDRQLVSLLKSYGLSLRKKEEIARIVNALPVVSMVRLDHLGRVLWSLCHAYSGKGSSANPNLAGSLDAEGEGSSEIPQITFTQVQEGVHVPFELILLVKNLLLKGDIAGIRKLREMGTELPLDRMIVNDAVKSVRYNLMAGTASWTTMLFDQNLPFEQLMSTHDQFFRLADQTNTIPELIDLIFDSIEAFGWLVRRYSTRQYSKPVRIALHYIQAHLAERIRLDELAEVTGLSRSHLSRLLKKETGTSLPELINSNRIEESKFLLTNTDYPILRIAGMVGFQHQNNFALQFKKKTGMTPTYFRRNSGPFSTSYRRALSEK